MAQLLTSLTRRANWPILILLLALPGCSGGPLTKEYWEVPRANGVEPIKEGPTYPIQRVGEKSAATEWPNLANVPPRPQLPEETAKEQELLQQLEADRAAAKISN